jgi:hypothetical protein
MGQKLSVNPDTVFLIKEGRNKDHTEIWAIAATSDGALSIEVDMPLKEVRLVSARTPPA